MDAYDILLVAAALAAAGLGALAWLGHQRARSVLRVLERRSDAARVVADAAASVAREPAAALSTVMAALERRLLTAPRLLVFDEPTGRWRVRDPGAAPGDVEADARLAACAQRAWDADETVTDAGGATAVVAAPVPTVTGARAVLVVRRPAEVAVDAADDLVDLAALAGVLGAVGTWFEHPLAERERVEVRPPGSVDSLTGLGTPSAFLTALERRCQEADGAVVVLLLAIDGVESASEELGWRSGEEVVRIAARRLQRCLRPEDALARVEPATFGVMLAQPSDPDGAATVGARMLAAVETPVAVTGGTVRVQGRAALVWDASGDGHPGRLLPEAREALGRSSGEVLTTIRLGEPRHAASTNGRNG